MDSDTRARLVEAFEDWREEFDLDDARAEEIVDAMRSDDYAEKSADKLASILHARGFALVVIEQ